MMLSVLSWSRCPGERRRRTGWCCGRGSCCSPDDGAGNSEIARRLGICQDTARKWRGRYREKGCDGLCDAPRCGRPRVFPQRWRPTSRPWPARCPPRAGHRWAAGASRNWHAWPPPAVSRLLPRRPLCAAGWPTTR
ncbi:helix-turn-helix domain-containing protein [Actinomadura madurae]|uniref:helix-turn-helix domain-containing protein n=1 Tax=Actinomadura madurae TaxID=1993 RepID=UPI003D6AD8DD